MVKPIAVIFIEYFWAAGSLPPPYHDEIRIVIDRKDAYLTYWPDYVTDQVIPKEFRIAINQTDLEMVTRLLENLKKRIWIRNIIPMLGGETEYMIYSLAGVKYEIPAGLIASDREIVSNIYAHIRLLIPEVIWDEIESIRRTNHIG